MSAGSTTPPSAVVGTVVAGRAVAGSVVVGPAAVGPVGFTAASGAHPVGSWQLRAAAGTADRDPNQPAEEGQASVPLGLVGCDSCGGPAELVLTYPDTRFRLCAGCLAPDMVHVVEPLDPDDLLASDSRTRAERQDERW